MKTLLIFLFGVALAFPQMSNDNHDYIPPGNGDVRSPCPFLNTMANHGHLPRSGRAVTFEGIRQTIVDVLGLHNDFATVLTTAAKNGSPFYGLDPFDLDFLTQPGHEGDLSLFRYDQTETYHDQTPQKSLIKELIDQAYKDPQSGEKKIGYDQMKQFRGIRYQEEIVRHTPITNGTLGIGVNCVLLLEAFGRDSTISVEFLRSFIENEKLPDGWVKGDGSEALRDRIFGAIFSDACHWEVPI